MRFDMSECNVCMVFLFLVISWFFRSVEWDRGGFLYTSLVTFQYFTIQIFITHFMYFEQYLCTSDRSSGIGEGSFTRICSFLFLYLFSVTVVNDSKFCHKNAFCVLTNIQVYSIGLVFLFFFLFVTFFKKSQCNNSYYTV